MGWARLNSVTSVQRGTSRNRLDASFYNGPLSQGVGQPVTDSRLDSFPGVVKRTQEFRLTSAPGAIEWLGGLTTTARRAQIRKCSLERLLTGRISTLSPSDSRRPIVS